MYVADAAYLCHSIWKWFCSAFGHAGTSWYKWRGERESTHLKEAQSNNSLDRSGGSVKPLPISDCRFDSRCTRSTLALGDGIVHHSWFRLMAESNIDAKFESLRESGCSAKDVMVVAITDGLNFGETIQMLHRVFNLNFADAKEAWLQAKGIASSLDEYQRDLIPDIDEGLAELEKHTH